MPLKSAISGPETISLSLRNDTFSSVTGPVMFFNTSAFLSYLLQLLVSQCLNKTLRFLPFSAQNRGMAKSMRALRASNGRKT